MPKTSLKTTTLNEDVFMVCSCGKRIVERTKKALDRKKRLHFKMFPECNQGIVEINVGNVDNELGYNLNNSHVLEQQYLLSSLRNFLENKE